MKAAPFRYCRPESLESALELLAHYGDEARLLAGGQSLLPSLNMRLSAPAVLIDVSRIAALRGITEVPGGLRIGAMSRHQEVEHSALVSTYAPLLSSGMRHVAHPPIRALGTYGGSLALADPAAEAPAATLAHSATLVVRSQLGERRIKAENFFLGLYRTALEPGEILIAGEFTRPDREHRFVFRELARRSGDFATVGVALSAKVKGRRITEPRIVLFGVSDRPILASLTANALANVDLNQESMDRALDALATELEPWRDLLHDETTKLHLLRVLLKRGINELVA
jgi:carbon-monoxide dehydrogenase medium subunit